MPDWLTESVRWKRVLCSTKGALNSTQTVSNPADSALGYVSEIAHKTATGTAHIPQRQEYRLAGRVYFVALLHKAWPSEHINTEFS